MIVLRQLFNLASRGLEGFNRLNPIRPIFTEPENIAVVDPRTGIRLSFAARARASHDRIKQSLSS
jgi:hypothetical protein